MHPAQTVLFTNNGSLGWIGDLGRDRVVLFEARTGQVLRSLPDIVSPAKMTLSPDRRTVAVVSAGTNGISLIDTATYSVRRANSSQVATFDFTNNLVFNATGTRGFVADYNLSNVLVFDIPGSSFLRSIPLIANAKPGAVAITPSGEFLAVVTTGLRTSIGNYIAIIRTDTMLPFGTGRLLVPNADFSTANNIVFAPNGVGYVASLGTGQLFSFDPLTFLSSAIPTGLGAGAISISPDGNTVAVNNAGASNISLVDTRTRRIFARTPIARGQLNPLSQVEYSTNSRLGYLAVPQVNELVVFYLRDGRIRKRLTASGGPVQLFKNPEAGLLYSLNPQTLSLSASSFVLNFPILRQNADTFTGFAFSNPSDTPVTVILTAYESHGEPIRFFSGASSRLMTLLPRTQLAKVGIDLFNLQPVSEGWVQMTSLDEVTSGFFLLGNNRLTYLNGGTVTGEGSRRLVFTRIWEGSRPFDEPSRTDLNLVNLGLTSASMSLEFFDSQGQSQGTTTRFLSPLNRQTLSIRELFPTLPLPVTGGFVEVTASAALSGYQSIRFGDSLFLLPAQDADLPSSGPIYCPQFVSGFAGDSFFTDINLVNTSTRTVRAVLRLIDESGRLVAREGVTNPVGVDIPAKGAFSGRGSQIFGFPDESGDADVAVGSVVVQTEDSGLIGDVVFGEPGRGRFISSLPLIRALSSELVFSQVAEGRVGSLDFLTGIAMLNPGSSEVAVTVTVYTEEGRQVGSNIHRLAPNARTSRLLRELVPEAAGQIGGFVRLSVSGGGITAFEIFATTAPLQFLSSVPAQVLQ